MDDIEEIEKSTPPGRSPWVAMGVVLVGAYAAVLNVTVMGVALPEMGEDLSAARSALDVDWVITSFLLGTVLVQPATGWFADRFGRKRIFVASLLAFAAGAVVSGLATGMELMVVGRFVQGIGGGAVMPVSMAFVYDLFPVARRGSALGIWGVAIMAAPAVGPPLGGWVVTQASWRWLFVAFVVVSLVGAALAARLLEDVGFQERRRLDAVGWGLASVGVVLVVIGGRSYADADAGALPGLMLLGGAFACAVLVWRSLRRPHPIIEFRMLAVPTFAIGMAVAALLTVAQFGVLSFLPIQLQVVRGLDAQEVGLLLAPQAIGTSMTMPGSGWLVDRIGARTLVVAGLALMCASMWELAHIDADVTDARLAAILFVQGLGGGLSMIPAAVAAMNSLPSRFIGQATAFNSLNRQLAGALGVAVLGAIVVAQLGEISPADADLVEAQRAYNRVYLVAFWFLISTLVAGFFLPGRRTMRQHQADRAAEQPALAVEHSSAAGR